MGCQGHFMVGKIFFDDWLLLKNVQIFQKWKKKFPNFFFTLQPYLLTHRASVKIPGIFQNLMIFRYLYLCQWSNIHKWWLYRVSTIFRLLLDGIYTITAILWHSKENVYSIEVNFQFLSDISPFEVNFTLQYLQLLFEM